MNALTITANIVFALFLVTADSNSPQAADSSAAQSKITKLPAPQKQGGKPLMQCLNERKTSRSFSPEKLSRQQLSNLLWAAFGVNRPDGKRTAPSAMNMQEIDIYIAAADGLYLYHAPQHSLELIMADDIRAATGGQPFVKDAPVNLVYVADYSKMRGPDDGKDFYSAADTGFISQNVYLYCASEGLATVVRGWVDKDALAEKMNLPDDKKITLTQTVGHPTE